MTRVKNLKSQRYAANNPKLVEDIEEIKSLLKEQKPLDQPSKLTEIAVMIPKELALIKSKISSLTEEIELMEKFDKDLNKNIFDGVDEKDLEAGPFG